MKTIDEQIKTIQNARFGKEVREPVAKTLEIIQEKINFRPENGIKEEILSARGIYASLAERVNVIDNIHKRAVAKADAYGFLAEHLINLEGELQ